MDSFEVVQPAMEVNLVSETTPSPLPAKSATLAKPERPTVAKR